MSLALDDSTGFDEPGSEAPEVTAAKDRNTLAIVEDMDRVKNSLNEFDRVSAGLADLEARYPKDAIYPVETTKGMKDAVEHRAAWRDPRIMVEKARKMAKAPLLALGKNIDARAAWLTEKLEEGERPVDQQIKAEEKRREEEKRQRALAEAGRILAIQEALAEIGENVLIACGKTSAEVRALSEQMHATQPDPDVFQEMIGQAKEAWVAAIAKLETTLKAKLWEEAEQARIAEEQAAEAERRRQEAERIEAQRIENERIRAEQAEQAAKLAAQQAEIEKQRQALEAERLRQERVESERKARIALRMDELSASAIRYANRPSIEISAAIMLIKSNEPSIDLFGDRLAEANDLQAKTLEALEGQLLAAREEEQNSAAQDTQQVLKAEPETADATDRDAPVISSPDGGPMGAGQAAAAAPVVGVGVHVAGNGVRFIRPAHVQEAEPKEVPMLKLGELWIMLGLDDREAFLASLGFNATPAPKGTGKLYRESDVPAIRRAIAKRMTEEAKSREEVAA